MAWLGLKELEYFHLELEHSRTKPDQSRSNQTVWGDGLRAGTEEGDSVPRRNNQHSKGLLHSSLLKLLTTASWESLYRKALCLDNKLKLDEIKHFKHLFSFILATGFEGSSFEIR